METQQVITAIKQVVAQMEGPARELYASAYRLNYTYAILDAVIGSALVIGVVIAARSIMKWRRSDNYNDYLDDTEQTLAWIGCFVAVLIGVVLIVSCVPRFVAPDLGAVSILRDTFIPSE